MVQSWNSFGAVNLAVGALGNLRNVMTISVHIWCGTLTSPNMGQLF